MDDLIAWLTACLDEIERVARAATDDHAMFNVSGEPGEWPNPCTHGVGPYPPSHSLCARLDARDMTIYDEGGHTPEQAVHIALHDPRAVLARVEAERAVLRVHRPDRASELGDPMCDRCKDTIDYGGMSEGEWPCETVALHAYGHRFDHPGYLDEWVPDSVQSAST